MSIVSGARLGPYEIVDSIGAGGMGEVWRARDTRLDRDVAIKILPAGFAQNEQFLQRFEREARMISSLNHPHICTLFDVGAAALDREGEAPAEPLHYLVMELIEGESLADRLKKGPLPLHDVLKYGRQVASALDAAHKRGVIHRDLKPGNIMLTKSGAKLLDFGLAKSASEGRQPVEGLASMPTEAKPITKEQTILGTFQYMAPEQLEGLAADARTDIFAFGAVLYEMATGRRAFRGETKTSLIAAIVSQQPVPVSAITPMTPPALDHVVRRCLEKDPDDRWQSAQDIASELQWISESGSAAVAQISSGRNRRTFLVPLIVALTLTAGLAAGYGIANTRPAASSTPSIQASIALPAGTQLAGWGSPSIAISPDGTVIAYVANRGGRHELYLRRLDESEARLVEGSDGAEGPFFSPDGMWVGFGAGGISARSADPPALKKAAVSGGPAQTISPIGDYFGGTWGDDNVIYFAGEDGLQLVRAQGGITERVKLAGEEPVFVFWPQFVPGAGILGLRNVGGRENEVVLIDPASGTVSSTSVRAVFARVVNDLLFFAHVNGSMLAVPFDVQRGQPNGTAVPIFSDVALTGNGAAAFAVAENGTAVWVNGYVRGSNRELRRLARLDGQGGIEPLGFEPDALSLADLSPDGRHVVASSWIGELWIYDLERKTRSRIATDDQFEVSGAIWSPDGTSLAYNSERSHAKTMMMQPVNGAEPARMLLPGERGEYWPGSFTPDGRSLVYSTVGTRPDQHHWEILVMPLDDPSAARKLANGMGAILSPDGKWMAYDSDESGSWEVQLQSFPEPATKIVLSRGGGRTPSWSRDGRRLYYWAGNSLMAVDVTGPSRSDVGLPQKLFDAPDLDAGLLRRTGRVMPTEDGFLVVAPVPGSGVQTHLNLATNWIEEVRGRIAGQ